MTPTTDDDLLAAMVAIRTGDLAALRSLIDAHPSLATSRLNGTWPLHVVTDWPGYFPNGPRVARMLIDAGADLDAGCEPDSTGETPLHYAASSDDSDVALVLIEAGANLEVPDGSIGTPLDNAIGYGCWNVARLLVERGAKVDKLWHAAALGMSSRLDELLAGEVPPEDISQAFWHACAGSQRRAAELLLGLGANLNWVPDYARGTPLDAAAGGGTRQENVISWLKELGARSDESD